jgi:hypothetical protein
MSVTSNFNSELNNYFTKINLEKLNRNNPLSRGTSTNPAKKIASMHKRNYSNPIFVKENSSQANLLEKNFSKLNLLKEEENLNIPNNYKNQNLAANTAGSHPLDSYILKHKGPVLSINRKKASVSPLQKAENYANNNNNNFNYISDNSNSGNNFFLNAENKKNQILVENNNKSSNNAEKRNGNDFGTVDIKFEIKNKHFQLPNLYPENKFKKITNYRNAMNLKRVNNSITPNKFIYNSQNITNIVAKKEESLYGEVNTKCIRRFNYPTATQILQNRVI